MKPAETRPSLLIRICNPTDRDAWNEFSSIYRPAIVRIAKQRGLQNADAEDLAQQVLLSVAKAIEGWVPDPKRARFRTWLNRIASNAVTNAITRRRPDQAMGRDLVESLAEEADEFDSDPTDLTIEVRREAFRFAADKIRNEFQPDTWQAFWLTAVDGLTVDEVARQLEKSRGSVYAARSRVMRRLKNRIHELQILDWKNEDE